ncbi:carboxypeptidase-like regulatory domain-containing protein [Maribacter litopenaei]|uniref:Carboxypeptidase-like regulatory domain-containing protein n=1 Tax=Maribacter litopenaei TaxID=2976127 RepID=A0ABY5YAK2_9FLAO|nr:carboxypeptidase-like regulatory domain-containing protein [Maribacter litopenaei]UWX55145.1 carboxypeptidase-like regulatory domain-containing protein [Maribacter litopenaei]
MKVMIIGIFFMIPFLSIAQNTGVLKGKVLDAEVFNEPLMMANLQLKNTEWQTRTNFNGNFEFEAIEPGKYILQISFPGYETLEQMVEINADQSIYLQKALYGKSINPVDLMMDDSAKMDK